MSRRLRLLSSLAALAVGCAVALALAPRARQPARAIAAEDCVPKPGDRMLGSALLHVPAGAKAPLPLVMAFHGAGGTGPGMAGDSGLPATAAPPPPPCPPPARSSTPPPARAGTSGA